VAYIAPPRPPVNLTATPGEGEVTLRWDPPARLVDDSSVQGEITYEVLRAAQAEAALEVITAAPVQDTRFTDRGLVNDRTYEYAVRALRAEAGGRARSQTSSRLAATPRDTTAPAAPERLVAVVSGPDVRLSWAPSPDSDVARYVVYRTDARGAFVRIGVAVAPITTFVDRGVAAGAYRYAVAAQDASSRANESARSNEAGVTVP
jgi:fibronectin type 3 domain-containing protein